MRRQTALVATVATALAVLLVAGCGAGGGGSGRAVDLDDDRTEEQLAADRAAAEQALLVLADFPPGWTAAPRDDDAGEEDEGPQLDSELADCLDVDEALLGESRVEAKSDTFSFDEAEVEAEVSVLPTRAYADEVVRALNRPEARGCFENVFVEVIEYSLQDPAEGEELPEGVSFGDVRLDDLDFADLGEDSRAFRVSMPIRIELLSIDLYFDLVFIRVGRAIGTVSFLDDTRPFDAALSRSLAGTFASRLPGV